jgi:hypothetical protein
MSKTQKEAIFAKLVNDAEQSNLSCGEENTLICPLCWTYKRFEDFTIEHVIPQSVGGNHLTLTCERCNSTSGHRLDHHLASYLQSIDQVSGIEPMKVRLNVAGNRLSANLTRDANAMHLHIVGRASNPKEIGAVHQLFASGQLPDVDIHFSYPYSRKGLKSAVLRCAYLIAFSIFGYGYLSDPLLTAIRQLLADSSDDDGRIDSLVFVAGKFNPPDDRRCSITPIKFDQLEALLVMLRVGKKKTCDFGVWMPMPSTEESVFFANVQEIASKFDRQTIRISPPRVDA